MKYYVEIECKRKNFLQIVTSGLQFFLGWLGLWAIACAGGLWYLLEKFKKVARKIRGR